MKILFDQSTPVPLRRYLQAHDVRTAFELGWSSLSNGELLKRAERLFDLIITTDQKLRYQQNLIGRKLAILVLLTTSWPRLIDVVSEICEAVEGMRQGEYREINIR
jgi:hypothetical protein